MIRPDLPRRSPRHCHSAGHRRARESEAVERGQLRDRGNRQLARDEASERSSIADAQRQEIRLERAWIVGGRRVDQHAVGHDPKRRLHSKLDTASPSVEIRLVQHQQFRTDLAGLQRRAATRAAGNSLEHSKDRNDNDEYPPLGVHELAYGIVPSVLMSQGATQPWATDRVAATIEPYRRAN